MSANLNYLIARTPQRQSVDITKTCLLMLAVSVVSALVVVVLRNWIVPPEIENAWLLLAVYVFMFLNLEVLVSYWLAHRQSLQVMVYTVRRDRLAARHAARRHFLAARRADDLRHHRLRRSAEESRTRHPARPIQVINYGALPAAEWQRIREAGWSSS